jgi:hypothetical protein
LKDLLDQIERGIGSSLYYLSLFTALAIPDICGALASRSGEATGKKYRKWFDKYVAPKYGGKLDGKTCYLFRCSLLHQGTTRHSRSKFKRIMFVEPGKLKRTQHNRVLHGALLIDVRLFCLDITAGANLWLEEKKKSTILSKHLKRSIKRYEHGLLPYVGGVPVIG